MEFETYLIQKKIDGKAFLENEPDLYKNWEKLFEGVHPESFTVQKKFQINIIRRKYLLNT